MNASSGMFYLYCLAHHALLKGRWIIRAIYSEAVPQVRQRDACPVRRVARVSAARAAARIRRSDGFSPGLPGKAAHRRDRGLLRRRVVNGAETLFGKV